VFDWVVGVISQLGYLGVGMLALLEHIFPPLPSELVIPLAGLVAARGDLQLALVIAAGTVGSLAGTTVWYWIGRAIGEQRLRAWVKRHGRWITLGTRDVDRAQQWFERHGAKAVFFGRLVPGVRTLVSLPAGFTPMPVGSFLLYSTLGTVVWTAALAWAGVVLQANFTLISNYINIVTNISFALAGAWLIRRYVICWRESRD
jgi:membrane protein DedA with SNARE-associated domain